MKKLALILAVSLFSFQGFSDNKIKNTESEFNLSEDSTEFRDCTIHVEGTTDDGKEYNLDITITDVSWIKCQAIKLLVE